jgi:hypothetical protein
LLKGSEEEEKTWGRYPPPNKIKQFNILLYFRPNLDMINDADLDGNKVLDFEEFLIMMEKKV